MFGLNIFYWSKRLGKRRNAYMNSFKQPYLTKSRITEVLTDHLWLNIIFGYYFRSCEIKHFGEKMEFIGPIHIEHEVRCPFHVLTYDLIVYKRYNYPRRRLSYWLIWPYWGRATIRMNTVFFLIVAAKFPQPYLSSLILFTKFDCLVLIECCKNKAHHDTHVDLHRRVLGTIVYLKWFKLKLPYEKNYHHVYNYNNTPI